METITTLKPTKLTAKQKRWLEIYTKTLNATEAAMQVYDCKDRNSASLIGHENLRKLNFNELMDAVGITDEAVTKTLREGLQADKTIILDGKAFSRPDHAVRHKYAETALKLKGKLADAAKLEVSGPSGGAIPLVVMMYGSKDPIKKVVDGRTNSGTPQLQPLPVHDSSSERPASLPSPELAS